MMIQVNLTPDEGYQAKTVAAVGVGFFAIHRDGICKDKYWLVTHVPTGLLIGWFFSSKYALHYTRWLMSLAIDWQNIKSRDEAMNVISRDIRQECYRMVYSEPVPDEVS